MKKTDEALTNGSADLHDGISNIKELRALLADVERVSAVISHVVAKIVRAKSGMGA